MSAGVSLMAMVKVPGSRLTLAGLEEARDELRGVGAPSHARLKVTHYAQGGWEIVADWEPVLQPEDPSPRPATLEEAAHLVAERIQRDTRGVRKLKDNPQA